MSEGKKHLKKKHLKSIQTRRTDGYVDKSEWSDFLEGVQSIQAKTPTVWKTISLARSETTYTALDQINALEQTLDGEVRRDFLLTGDKSGFIRFIRVCEGLDAGERLKPSLMMNYAGGRANKHGVPAVVLPYYDYSTDTFSRITSLRLGSTLPYYADELGPNIHRVLFTQQGYNREREGGKVFAMNIAEPLQLNNEESPIQFITQLNCEVFTSEYMTRSQAVIGTQQGANYVNLETGQHTVFLQSESVCAVQAFNSGNSMLCGMADGTIIAVDVRGGNQTQTTMRCPPRDYSQADFRGHLAQPQRSYFTLMEGARVQDMTRMPSTMNSLVSLQSEDRYFVANSKDLSVCLYDIRNLRMGAVKSYEWANRGMPDFSHSMQLQVDFLERFLLSGGADGYVRLWNIKSGELLFEENFSQQLINAACFRKYNYPDIVSYPMAARKHSCDYPIGSWLASDELYYIDWASSSSGSTSDAVTNSTQDDDTTLDDDLDDIGM